MDNRIRHAANRAGDARWTPRVVLVQCGSDVHVQIGGSIVDVMGAQVMLNPVVLDVGANSGGLIGSLVCQVHVF